MCKDAIYDSFDYDHTFYAFLWILLTVLGAMVYGRVYGSVKKVRGPCYVSLFDSPCPWLTQHTSLTSGAVRFTPTPRARDDRG